MYISEIIIEQFGAKTNERISLEPEFNLITGANETGKSTLCAFIKYVLYGFDDAKERKRHSALDTGNASGALIIVHNGKKYRIQRKNQKNVSIYDEESGNELVQWKDEAQTPGEYFLQVSASLYTRAVYVNQAERSRLDSDTASAVSNLLLTGDEAINLKRAKKILEESRKALKLKKGIGGKICELEAQIKDMQEKLDTAVTAKMNAQTLYAALHDIKIEIEALKKQIDSAKNADEMSKSIKIRTHLDKQSEMLDLAQKKQFLLTSLIEDNTYNGFLPDDEYENSIRSLQSEINVYQAELQKAEAKLQAISGVKEEPTEYKAYCQLGKKEKILQKHTALSNRLKLSNTIMHVSVFVALISLMAILASLISDFLGNSKPFVIVFFGISLSCALVGLALKVFFKGKLKAIIKPLGASESKTVDYICRHCEEYELANEKSNVRILTESIDENKRTLSQKKADLDLLLAKWNKNDVAHALGDYIAFTQKREKLQIECSEIKASLSITEAHLSIYTESEISAAASLNTSQITENIIQSESISELNARLNAATERKNNLELQIAQISSPHTEIEFLTGELDKKTSLLDEYQVKHDAIVLTLSALDEAENIIRSTVSPYLGAEASVFFNKITEGRYDRLRVDSEMDMTYIKSDSDTVTDEEYLSIGSADLAWLCLRLALHKKLAQNSNIPLILDEALVYFDDNRLALIINELTEIAENGTQILLFSASSRELAMLGGAGNIIRLG